MVRIKIHFTQYRNYVCTNSELEFHREPKTEKPVLFMDHCCTQNKITASQNIPFSVNFQIRASLMSCLYC